MLWRNLLKNLCLFLLFCSAIQAKELKDYLPANPVIFDVGANIGEKTAHYLSLGAKMVICVEPNPTELRTLFLKYSGNIHVFILPIGLADKKGKILFHPYGALGSADKEWMTKGRFKNCNWPDPVEIEVNTLDSVIEEFGMPDFCKIDVEGYELNVLNGLNQPIPLISFEFTYEFLTKKTQPCLQRLYELGYRKFNVAYSTSETFVHKDWVDWERLLKNLQRKRDSELWGDIYAKY